tara:strand:- start:10168 stop:11205 length:1038 start_codon:yes stop_codon:yes gene_type:complete
VLKPQHILIIRLSAMGDVAMTVPVIRAFVHQHPNCKVTVVSKPFLKPLFEGISNVSFFAADVKGTHKGILGLFRLFRALKKEGITHIADFHNVLRSKILRTFFKLNGKPTTYIDKGRAEKKALTRSENKIFKQLKTSHQRYADVLGKLGFDVNLSNPILLEKKSLSKKLRTQFGVKEQQWIGIAPFAAFEGKVYPLHLMEEVIKKLSSKGFKIFLFGGGKQEIKILTAIENKVANIINVAGEISFAEEIELIRSLDLMISMDSGNAHLAAMQQLKTITIWGVTHPYAGFAPFNQPSDYCLVPDLEKYAKIPCSIYGNKVFDGYEKVMESINPKRVVEKVMNVLGA